MTEFDYAAIGIVVLSVGVGLWRGAVYEVLSLLGWPIAFFASQYGAPKAAVMLPITAEATRNMVAYALVFIAVLLVWAVVVWGLSKFIKAVGMGWLDSILGGCFGVLRGAMLLLVLVWIAGMTHLPEQKMWRDAKFSRDAEQMALLAKFWLPDDIARRIKYRAQD
ncbi:MAG: CvpA family protein [Gallionella sp.]